MKQRLMSIYLTSLMLIFSVTLFAQKNNTENINNKERIIVLETELKNLKETREKNTNVIDYKIETQGKHIKEIINEKEQNVKEIATEKEKYIERLIYIVVSLFAVTFYILSFFGYRLIQKRIKLVIDEKTEDEVKKYLTEEIMKKLIEERGAIAIDKTVEEFEDKFKEKYQEIDKIKNEYEAGLQEVNYIEKDKPISKEDKQKLEDFVEHKLKKIKEEENYTADDWFYKGFNEYENKNYNKAKESYTKAIELNPKYTYAYNNRGIVYHEQKDYDNAIKDYNKAIELNPNRAGFYCNRGSAYFNKKDYDNTIKDYNKAIELNPEFAFAYYNRGNIYYEQKYYDNAIKDYNKAIELNPEYTFAYNNRGFVYAKQKDYDNAIKDYNKAIELNPKYANVYYNRGIVYDEQKDYNNAIKDYNKAIELNPNNALAYENLSELYIITGKNEEAYKTINKIQNLDLSTKERTLYFYLKTIAEILLNKDFADSENRLKKQLEKEFTNTFSLRGIEEWLREANISEEKKDNIIRLTDLMKNRN